MKTRTGRFPIGFRRGGGWQDDIHDLAEWAKEAGFEAIDLGRATPEDAKVLEDNDLAVGSCDLIEWPGLFSQDTGEQWNAIQANIDYIRSAHALGGRRFFLCVMPKDPSLPKKENLAIAARSLSELAREAEKLDSMLVIEGWPGGWPEYSNLACNPETYRWLIRECHSKGLGINYDPSHLIRMGIDHVRFLEEFVGHVGHVHAKDTEIQPEKIYEFGLYQFSAVEPHPHCGESVWRYTIPGHGQARWVRIFQILQSSGYKGFVSVELEDHSFHGSPEAEKEGLLCSLAFLRTA
ncbi:MAG: Inosose dehydratase [bacterium]|nr:Inosose dehydratase [bacterium]